MVNVFLCDNFDIKGDKKKTVVPKWMSVNIPVTQNVLNEVKSFILFSTRGR